MTGRRGTDGPGEADPEADLPGDVVEMVIQACRRRGMAASVLHPLSLDLAWVRTVLERGPAGRDDGREQPLTVVPGFPDIRFANTRVRELGRRLIHQHQVLFCFKVVYRSDETREELVSLLVDPLTEAVEPVPALRGAVDIALEGGAPLDGYPLRRLYRRACRHVHQAVQPQGHRLQQEARQRLERDMERLEDYYEGLRQEALESVARELHRLEAVRNRQRLWRSLTGEAPKALGRDDGDSPTTDHELAALQMKARRVLAALAADRERRLQELKDKYQVRAEAALVGAALVWTPRVEVRCKLMGPARREILFYYDPIRGRLVDLDCETCGAPLDEVYLCAAGDVCCPRCFARCAGCGHALCRGCASHRCHLCDSLLCGHCDTGCPLPASMGQQPQAAQAAAVADRWHVCPACRAGTCHACAGLAQVLTG